MAAHEILRKFKNGKQRKMLEKAKNIWKRLEFWRLKGKEGPKKTTILRKI